MLEPNQTPDTLARIKKLAFMSALTIAKQQCQSLIKSIQEDEGMDKQAKAKGLKDQRAHLIALNKIDVTQPINAIATPLLIDIMEQSVLLYFASDELVKDILKIKNSRTKKEVAHA